MAPNVPRHASPRKVQQVEIEGGWDMGDRDEVGVTGGTTDKLSGSYNVDPRKRHR